MAKALAACIPLLLLPMLLSGCWERKELNELAFVLGLGLDKAEDGYKVSMQVVIPSSITSQSAGGSGEAVYRSCSIASRSKRSMNHSASSTCSPPFSLYGAYPCACCR